jgi:hypothetical protein
MKKPPKGDSKKAKLIEAYKGGIGVLEMIFRDAPPEAGSPPTTKRF